MRAWILAVVLAMVATAASAEEGCMVAVGDKAYLVAPGELAAAGQVTAAKWSNSGNYILAVQRIQPMTRNLLNAFLKAGPTAQPPAPQTNLILCDARTGKAQKVWSAHAGPGASLEVQWFAGSDAALATWMAQAPPQPGGQPTMRRGILLVDAANGKARTLLEGDDAGFDQVELSPFAPLAVVVSDQGVPGPGVPTAKTYLAKPDGSLKLIPRPAEGLQGLSPTWSATGDLLLRGYVKPSDGTRKLQSRWFRVNPQTLQSTAISNPKLAEPVATAGLMSVVSANSDVKRDDTTAKVSLLWLEAKAGGPGSRGLLCADGQWGSVSPKSDAVMWCARGALWLAPMLEISKAQLEEMRNAARRTMLMSNGKQVALSVLMYCQDYDEQLPGPDGLQAKLEPYAKNSAIFEGLVYTFPGGKLADVQRPAETLMGYIPGAGGRAEIFMDGHVKWKAD